MKKLSPCSLFTLAIVAAIGIANAAEVPSTSEAAWAMFQHDPSHTSRSSLHAVSNPGTRKWEFFTNKGLPETSPAVARDGTIYLGADDYLRNKGGELFAVNSDGTLKWKFATAGGVRFSPAIGTDGTIYFGANDCLEKSSGWLGRGSHSCLYALSPEGKLKWQFNTDDPLYASSPIIGSDGTIYIGNDGGALFAINRDGTPKWKYRTGGAVGVPAIGANGTIYVNSKDGNLYAINSNATLKWKYLIGDEGLPASPAIGADGTIYVGSYHEGGRGAGEHYVYAIKPDGSRKWQFGASGVVMSAPAIGEDGTIYVTGGLHFYAINPDGARKWELPIRPRSAPAIGSDGTIYFESFPEFNGERLTDTMFAINPDGSIKWHTPMDNQVSGSPAIGDDGTVYVASEDGKLSAFGQATASVSAPASLDFGSSPLWNNVTRTFTIANTGSVDLFIKDVDLSNHCGFRDFTLGASTCPPGKLAPGLSCAIAVTFSPLATGSRSAPLTITDNAGSGSQTVTLTGTGTPDLTMSAETLGWNRVKAGSSSSRSITIANHQTIPVALSTSIGGASGHDFSISPGSCKSRLAANSSCTIEVSFSPATTGDKSAYLSIAGNPDAISFYRVPLSGSGI
jgi:outer membrane protein assembly factor BamB